MGREAHTYYFLKHNGREDHTWTMMDMDHDDGGGGHFSCFSIYLCRDGDGRRGGRIFFFGLHCYYYYYYYYYYFEKNMNTSCSTSGSNVKGGERRSFHVTVNDFNFLFI